MNEWSSSLTERLKQVNSKRTTVPPRELHVCVNVTAMSSFNHAFVSELERKNPLLSDKLNLTEEELIKYETFLLVNRVDIVNQNCKIIRNLKYLAMPCFVERVMTDVGICKIRDRALIIYPKVSDELRSNLITLEEAIQISSKIESCINDLAVVERAMPLAIEGNPEVMTLALIEDYVVGMGDYDDPLVQYITFALSCMLEETEFNNLYYMRYDDVKTIESNICVLGRSLVV